MKLSKSIVLGMAFVIPSIVTSQPDTAWTIAARGDFGTNLQVIRTSDGGFAIGGGGVTNVNRHADFHLVKTDSLGRTEWDAFYAGTPNDHHVADFAKSVCQLPDDGYVLAGITGGEGMVVRTDADGEMIWMRYYLREDGLTNFWECAPFDDGGVLVAGWAMIVKLDEEDGDVEWSRTIEGARFWGLDKTSDGGFILGGDTRSMGAGSADFFALKIDSEGETEWMQAYGTEDAEFCSAVIQTSDGGYCFAGGTSGDCYTMIVLTDSEGEPIWQRHHNDWRGHNLRDVVETPDGGFAAVGFNGTRDYYLMRVDYAGDVHWRTIYNRRDVNYCYSLLLMGDGGYLLGGFAGLIGCWLVRTEPDPVDLPFELEIEVDEHDFEEVTIDSVTVWEFELRNTGRRYVVIDTLWFEGDTSAFSCPLDLPFRINPEDTSHVPVLFQPSSDTTYTATLILPYGDEQTLEIILSGRGFLQSAPEELNILREFVLHEAYPNPFNSSTSINYSLDRDGFVTLKLFDLSGREVVTLINGYQQAGSYRELFNAQNLPSGIYICRLEADDNRRSVKIALIR